MSETNLYSSRSTITLYHRNLLSVGDSMYRKECPFCSEGMFLIERDQETFILQVIDRCINCGQKVMWEDIKEMRENYG